MTARGGHTSAAGHHAKQDHSTTLGLTQLDTTALISPLLHYYGVAITSLEKAVPSLRCYHAVKNPRKDGARSKPRGAEFHLVLESLLFLHLALE